MHFILSPTLAKRTAKASSSNDAQGDTYTIGSFTTSRFIIGSLAMVTSEHKAVDLSLLLNSGLLGLSQTVMRIAGVYWECGEGRGEG